jgi:hypothetical protein
VVEDREEEVVVPFKPHGCGPGRARAGEAPGSGRESRELIYPPRELQCPAVADIHPVGSRNVGDNILELVLQAEADKVGDPAHGQEEHAPATPGYKPRTASAYPLRSAGLWLSIRPPSPRPRGDSVAHRKRQSKHRAIQAGDAL